MKGERGEGIEGRPSGPWEFILSGKILLTLVSFREHCRTTVRLVRRMELGKEGGKGNLSFLVRFLRRCSWKFRSTRRFRFTRVWIFFQVDGNNEVSRAYASNDFISINVSPGTIYSMKVSKMYKIQVAE